MSIPNTPSEQLSTAATGTQPQLSPHEQELQNETQRLQREIDALKKLQQLKQEEEELKRWLSGHDNVDGVSPPSRRRSSGGGSSGGRRKNSRGNFYDQETPGGDNNEYPPSSLMPTESTDSLDESDYSASPPRNNVYSGAPSPGGGGIKRRKQQQNYNSELDESDYSLDDNERTSKGKRRGKRGSSLPLSTQAYNILGSFALEVKRRFISATTVVESPSSPPSSDETTNTADVESHGKYSKTRNGKKGGGPPKQVSTRELLYKIGMAIITDIDDETLQREDTETILIIITLLKEAILGIVIAFLAVSFVLFLDHYFLLNLPTARNFRRATFAAMNDHETLRSFEENAGMKFMEMAEYTGIVNEIEQAANKTKLASSIFDTRSQDLIDMQVDLTTANIDAKSYMKQLGLDTFCNDCIWSQNQKLTCDGRVKQLGERYQTPKYKAMMSAMQKESCRNLVTVPGVTPKEKEILVKEKMFKEWNQEEEDEKMSKGLATEQDVVKNWHRHAANFCSDCEWDAGMTCAKRGQFLNERYGTPMIEAMAKVMVEMEKCRHSYYEKRIKSMGGYCGSCVWGTKKTQTCNARVEYLIYTYKNPENVAKLAAMDKVACRGSNQRMH